MSKKEFTIPYIEDLNTGLYEDRFDSRDYNFKEEILGAGPMYKPEWSRGFELEVIKKGYIKVENQGSSLSCVAQAYSKYAEILNWYDTKGIVDLSARDIYSQIHYPNGGSGLADGANLLVKKGVTLESEVPSYDQNGNALSEADFRLVNRTETMKERALRFKGLSYYSVDPDIDTVAMAITMGHGVAFGANGTNKGWGSADVVYYGRAWGHAILAVGYCMRNGKKAIKFINSWGDKWGDGGYGYINEDYFNAGGVFRGRVVIDNPNLEESVPLITIKKKGEPHIYIRLDSKKKLLHIVSWPSYIKKLSYGQIKSFVEVDELPKGYDIVDEADGLIL